MEVPREPMNERIARWRSEASAWHAQGDDDIAGRLKAEGCDSPLVAIAAYKFATGCDTARAQQAVFGHPAWSEETEAVDCLTGQFFELLAAEVERD